MQERRKTQRMRTYLGGEVVFNQQCPAQDCLVRNLSQNGAKLTFSEPAQIPAQFNLTIHKNSESRRARIIWRGEKEVGVSFLEAATATVITIKAARRIKTLEAARTP